MSEIVTDSTPVEKKPTTYKKLLKDLGPQLPIGSIDGDRLMKDMETKPWKLKQERELGELREKHRDANLAQYVSMVLGSMYKHLGGYNLEELSLSDKRARMGRLFMGDIFYSYIWLRCNALSNVLIANLTCPACSNKFEFPADLHTTEVVCADSPEALKWKYTLQDPIEIQGQNITHFEMGPAKWRTLEGADFSAGLNTGAAKALIIRGSIAKVPELVRGALGEADLDELTKRDLEALTRAIDEHTVGPNMSIETRCTRCRSDFKVSLDWGYDSFFGISSRSGT